MCKKYNCREELQLENVESQWMLMIIIAFILNVTYLTSV